MREQDESYLNFIRQQPCAICGDDVHVEAAHLRVASINDDKEPSGMGSKPSDRWSLPLCGRHHRQQHTMNELEFWASYGINPFELCQKFQVMSRIDRRTES